MHDSPASHRSLRRHRPEARELRPKPGLLTLPRQRLQGAKQDYINQVVENKFTRTGKFAVPHARAGNA